MDIRSDRGGYSLSGISASSTGSAIDMRGTNGAFMLILSASGGASGGASATVYVQHSHDLTAWMQMGQLVTASATGTVNSLYSAQFSGMAYGYVRVNATAVFSAAQTGTGAVWAYIMPGTN